MLLAIEVSRRYLLDVYLRRHLDLLDRRLDLLQRDLAVERVRTVVSASTLLTRTFLSVGQRVARTVAATSGPLSVAMIGGLVVDAFDLDERLLTARIDLLAARPRDVIRQVLRGLVMMPAKKFSATAATHVACHYAQSADIIVASLMLLKIAAGDYI